VSSNFFRIIDAGAEMDTPGRVQDTRDSASGTVLRKYGNQACRGSFCQGFYPARKASSKLRGKFKDRLPCRAAGNQALNPLPSSRNKGMQGQAWRFGSMIRIQAHSEIKNDQDAPRQNQDNRWMGT